MRATESMFNPNEAPVFEGGEENEADISTMLRRAYASAEDGLEQLPEEIEVENIEDVLNATNLSPDALEAFRSSHYAE